MTLKSDAEFEEKMTCGLENDMRNLINFYQSTWKSHNWGFDVILSSKVKNVWFTEELCVITMKNDAKFEEELTCRFKINMRKLTNFDPSTLKISQICTLMGSFWTNYIMFELKRYRGVMFHDTGEWCRIWRKTGLWFGKWHE